MSEGVLCYRFNKKYPYQNFEKTEPYGLGANRLFYNYFHKIYDFTLIILWLIFLTIYNFIPTNSHLKIFHIYPCTFTSLFWWNYSFILNILQMYSRKFTTLSPTNNMYDLHLIDLRLLWLLSLAECLHFFRAALFFYVFLFVVFYHLVVWGRAPTTWQVMDTMPPHIAHNCRTNFSVLPTAFPSHQTRNFW